MREIKFRAWNGLDMIMPMDKSYYQHYMSFCGCIVQKSSEGMACFGSADRWRVVDGLKIMQYTGLKDSNGVEIYEGDILKISGVPQSFYDLGKYCYGVAVFKGGSFLQSCTHDDGKVFYEKIEDCEIVGNTFQNPELLNG